MISFKFDTPNWSVKIIHGFRKQFRLTHFTAEYLERLGMPYNGTNTPVLPQNIYTVYVSAFGVKYS